MCYFFDQPIRLMLVFKEILSSFLRQKKLKRIVKYVLYTYWTNFELIPFVKHLAQC